MDAKDKFSSHDQSIEPEVADRRQFLTGMIATTATLASAPLFLQAATRHHSHHGPFVPRVPVVKNLLIGSGSQDGIVRMGWNAETGELTEGAVVAAVANPSWITLSPERHFLYAACEVADFDGKPTGGVASFRVVSTAKDGVKLEAISRASSAGAGTCQVAVDETGRVLISADYTGGSAASFLSEQGKFGAHVWSEKYTGSGPVVGRQEAAHAHFASFSPDGQFAYVNDLGSDCIHIYHVDAATAKLTAAGSYRSHAGAGPRTLHFHPNGHTGYVVNELDSTVDVVEWARVDGSLTKVDEIKLLPEGFTGETRAADTVISSDGLFVYFANRGNDLIYSFHAEPGNGKLTPIGRTPSGGRTPRHFILDPTERWMLVANQDGNLISVFARDKKTGELAGEGKSFPAKTPTCLVLV